MAEFLYKARTREGEARTGVLEARTREAAIDTLQGQNLIVTDIRPAQATPAFSWRARFFERVSNRDVVIFSRQLSTLFQAKVPVVQSLHTLAAESGSVPFRRAISRILEDVAGGSNLSSALGRHPQIFSRFYLAMVRAGEESGKLEEVFDYVADYLERSYALVTKTRNALIYPAFIFATFLAVIIVMLTIVIPRLAEVLADFGSELPIYTRALLGFAGFFQRWGVLLAVLLAAVAVAAWRYMLTEPGGRAFDRLKISIPIVGAIFKKVYLARMADALSMLIVAGIPIIRALEITAEVVSHRGYAAIILAAAQSVKGGSSISAAFERHPDIPPLVTQMIRVGEETGRLDFILEKTSAFYQRDVENLLENFVSLIEPALIILLGLGVAFLVGAVLVPLYNLAAVIS
ncbi:MAG: hypothetical protein A3B37_01635 [Candidatus Sungbacteria bacterium RIFCSPLOWO2_01_FULL_59_16]|uniref:Type II secretion system protein GspF domain-containing protein n=1 Tax=Candidatus Sungbacteria bacterium RIFCSPLOWO2_01_FULL_59_16 TaxID=1802280 RepID=A0A1G2L9S1_9BACT|nr:MAG: hypothetical protein A3B37_01635 [Candidatus Sungbacteria bacterium RIFCSPLOWO2_01_FULL_59_16]